MWAMLTSRAKDNFEIILIEASADADGGRAKWEAKYTFSQTGNLVHNKIDAAFAFRDGKIVRHVDRFSFWRWSAQALGPMGQGPNDAGMSRQHLMAQIDASLARLGLDHVDLYQIHGWDPLTPIEEALRALDDIVRSGRARYIGVSNWAAWQIVKALGISERLGLEKFASLQAYYTLAGRDLEREIVPMLASEGVGLMVWSPLAGGLLTGKYRRSDEGKNAGAKVVGEGRRATFDFPPVELDRAYGLIDAMDALAKAKCCTVAQIALAWLLYQPTVSTVIIGAKRADQLADNIGACDVTLSAAEMMQLEDLSALPREYPGWMLTTQGSYRSKAALPRRVAE